MEKECEYGLTSGTCFTARRLEVVAVAGLLWTYFVVCFFLRLVGFRVFFSFSLLRTHTAYCKHEATSCLIYLSTSTGVRTGCHSSVSLSVCVCVTFVGFRQGRGSEATEAVFCLYGKKASSYQGAYRVPFLNWSVCPSVRLSVSVCNIRRFC